MDGAIIVALNQINKTLLLFLSGLFDLFYGSFYGNEIAWTQASAVQNTWYNISDADIETGQGGLNGITHDGSGKLTVLKAGRYLINYGITLEVNLNNEHSMTGIEINSSGTAINDGRQHWDSVANKEICLSSTAIVNLAVNDTVELSVMNTDANTPNFTISHVNLSLIFLK